VVVHADPWWNAAAENQATDRAHRIGQKNEVSVFKVIQQDTIEERIVKLQEAKRDIADKIVSSDNVSISSLSREDLMELLGE
jgi:SNF2 family DNA or RNA helicase